MIDENEYRLTRCTVNSSYSPEAMRRYRMELGCRSYPAVDRDRDPCNLDRGRCICSEKEDVSDRDRDQDRQVV